MRKIFIVMSMLLFMLILIGTAYADWFTNTMTTTPVFPEHAALIGLGAVMVALGAYGRRTLSTHRSQD